MLESKKGRTLQQEQNTGSRRLGEVTTHEDQNIAIGMLLDKTKNIRGVNDSLQTFLG